MQSRPRLQDVASRAGVSLATVSQVMRGTGRISPATRARVEAAASALNYVRDTRAASMRSGENRELGMVIHGLANPFNAEVISGVTDELETEGYLVSVLDSGDDPARQLRNLKALISSTRGGLLWVPAHATDEGAVDLLRTHRMPTVTFLRDPPLGMGEHALDHLAIENEAATREATEHLVRLGHRRIAFFGGIGGRQVRRERIAGYAGVLERHALGPPVMWESADSKAAGLDAMLALHEAHPGLTALVCNGDMVAIGASLACQRLGLEAGRDLSIVGFDGTEDAATATPALTTMAISPRAIGRTLARTLLARMREPGRPPTRISVPATLVVRSTTNPPAGAP